MTKQDLAEKMQEFINMQNDAWPEEWYATDRVIYRSILKEFAEFINVKLPPNEEPTT